MFAIVFVFYFVGSIILAALTAELTWKVIIVVWVVATLAAITNMLLVSKNGH